MRWLGGRIASAQAGDVLGRQRAHGLQTPVQPEKSGFMCRIGRQPLPELRVLGAGQPLLGARVPVRRGDIGRRLLAQESVGFARGDLVGLLCHALSSMAVRQAAQASLPRLMYWLTMLSDIPMRCAISLFGSSSNTYMLNASRQRSGNCSMAAK